MTQHLNTKIKIVSMTLHIKYQSEKMTLKVFVKLEF